MNPALIFKMLTQAAGPEIQTAVSQGFKNPGARVGFGDIFKGKGMENISRRFVENMASSGQGPSGAEMIAGPWAAPFKGISGAVGAGVNAMQKESPFAAGGEMMRALPLGGLEKFGAGLIESVDRIRAFGDNLHGANMKFADVSASMAWVQAESDAHAIWLRMEQGERRAATAQELSDARTRLNRASAPFEDAWANIQNCVFTPVLEITADILERLEPMADYLESFADGIRQITDFINDWNPFARRQNNAQDRRPNNMR